MHFRTIASPAGQTLFDTEDPRRYYLGLERLDAAIGGLRPGELSVIGAQTGVGKSAFAEQIALEISEPWEPEPGQIRSQRVLFLPLEMGQRRTEWRMLAKVAGVSVNRIKAAKYSEDDREVDMFLEAVREFRRRNMGFYAQTTDEFFDLKALINTIVMDDPAVAIIDHLAHIEGWSVGANRPDIGAAAIVRKLTSFAQESGVHIVCVHQLKAIPAKPGMRPTRNDLADTAALARHADLVLLLHRPYRGEGSERDCVTEVIIDKNRNGPECRLTVGWRGSMTSYRNLSRDEEAEIMASLADRGKHA